MLRHVIKECNALFHNAKLNGGDDEVLKNQYRDARSNVKNAPESAKGKWIEHLVEDT